MWRHINHPQRDFTPHTHIFVHATYLAMPSRSIRCAYTLDSLCSCSRGWKCTTPKTGGKHTRHVYMWAFVYAAPGGLWRFALRNECAFCIVHRELRNTLSTMGKTSFWRIRFVRWPRKALFFDQIKFPLPVGSLKQQYNATLSGAYLHCLCAYIHMNI